MSFTITSANRYEIRERLNAAYPFRVEKRPLYAGDGSQTKHYGLFRTDTDECFGDPVSHRYEPHNLDQLSRIVEAIAEGFGNCPFRIQARWHDGHQIVVGPDDDQRRELADGSQIFPRAILSAGYNRGSAWGSMGVFRDRCANLILLETLAEMRFGFRHVGSLHGNLARTVEQFRTIKDRWPEIVAMVDGMQRQTVDAADILARLFPRPEPDDGVRTQRNWERTIEAITARLRAEPVAAARPTAWAMFNAIQGWSQHDRNRQGKPDALARVWKTFTDRKVAQALSLCTAA